MKKMKIIFISVIAGVIAFSANSCREVETITDDLDIPGLGGYEFQETELDKWLYETFTEPYNIAVYYRWDAVKNMNIYSHKLVPPKVEMIKPMMSALARVWFEPFLFSAPYGFLQEITPKTIVLTGSPDFDNNGTKTLGSAEGGRKIWLTSVNEFVTSDAAKVKGSLHVIEHEFTHILHQTRMYDPSYSGLSQGRFDAGEWTNYDGGVDDPAAHGLGFITAYAMSNSDEDFTETISMIMVYGMDWFNNTVLVNAADPANGNDPETAVAMLQAKLDYVNRYMMDVWGIRFLDSEEGEPGLVTRVQEAIADLLANP